MHFFKTTIITTIIMQAQSFSGDLTSYGATIGNQYCGFKKDSWNYQGLMTAAINLPQLSNSTSCGLCASIEYNGKRTNVLIDNLCPECKFGDLDLSHESWKSIIGNTDYGRTKASWEFIDCSPFLSSDIIITPFSINPWWLSVTPSNMRCGVSEMFIFVNDNWSQLQIGNQMNGLYFIYHSQSTPISGKFKFKLVSKLGEELETDWYTEIKEVFETKKQFQCSKEVNCFNRRLRSSNQRG